MIPRPTPSAAQWPTRSPTPSCERLGATDRVDWRETKGKGREASEMMKGGLGQGVRGKSSGGIPRVSGVREGGDDYETRRKDDETERRRDGKTTRRKDDETERRRDAACLSVMVLTPGLCHDDEEDGGEAGSGTVGILGWVTVLNNSNYEVPTTCMACMHLPSVGEERRISRTSRDRQNSSHPDRWNLPSNLSSIKSNLSLKREQSVNRVVLREQPVSTTVNKYLADDGAEFLTPPTVLPMVATSRIILEAAHLMYYASWGKDLNDLLQDVPGHGNLQYLPQAHIDNLGLKRFFSLQVLLVYEEYKAAYESFKSCANDIVCGGVVVGI
ncbi:hypothetical protein EDB85DRAFT_1895010 [Lactarius pseudohatsudake]|nr:hypothetical protein EDB85DRAFT_1895010 [Lactarius pseudohatsudake]